jgi:hypothetical protein
MTNAHVSLEWHHGDTVVSAKTALGQYWIGIPTMRSSGHLEAWTPCFFPKGGGKEIAIGLAATLNEAKAKCEAHHAKAVS